jgi:uncharacterized protein (DUF2252 family)
VRIRLVSTALRRARRRAGRPRWNPTGLRRLRLTPERRLVFDLNDFDETLPGPFEWDVKRLVASMAVAGRGSGFTAKKRRGVALATAAAYRTAMREFAAMSILDVWYARFDVEDALARLQSDMPKKAVRQTKAQIAKARARDSTQALTNGLAGVA